jgi:hypothetical protein
MSTLLAPAPAPERSRASAAPALRPSPRPQPRPERRPAPAERREHLRVVRPDERTMRRLTPKAGVALTALLFATLFAVAGAHTLIAQGQIRLDGLDEQVRTEQARYQQLRKDVAEGESPERVVAAAEAQGMVAPSDLVYLQPDAATEGSADSSTSVARQADGSWSTVKPLLEAPTP